MLRRRRYEASSGGVRLINVRLNRVERRQLSSALHLISTLTRVVLLCTRSIVSQQMLLP